MAPVTPKTYSNRLTLSNALSPTSHRQKYIHQLESLAIPQQDEFAWRVLPEIDPNDNQLESEFVATQPEFNLIASDTNTNTNHKREARHQQFLPNGPPPFRPPTILLSLNSRGLLGKIKASQTFKHMYKSKAYYFFLDALRQLSTLSDQMIQTKMQLTKTKLVAVQVVVNRLINKAGHKLKLKWPLILLNPSFLHGLLRDPTFLVMLFHAIETAYVSFPVKNIWLKPLVKFVSQPSLDKEEKIWWRRKRHYDLLNGPGSSELQPNLKARHFKTLGKLQHEKPASASVLFPTIVGLARKLTGKRAPDPNYYKYPPQQAPILEHFVRLPQVIDSHQPPDEVLQQHQTDLHETPETAANWNSNEMEPHYETEPKQNSAESKPQEQVWDMTNEIRQTIDEPSKYINDVLSQSEFDALDASVRESIVEEARARLEDSRLTEEMIKRQTDLIESLANKQVSMGSHRGRPYSAEGRELRRR